MLSWSCELEEKMHVCVCVCASPTNHFFFFWMNVCESGDAKRPFAHARTTTTTTNQKEDHFNKIEVDTILLHSCLALHLHRCFGHGNGFQPLLSLLLYNVEHFVAKDISTAIFFYWFSWVSCLFGWRLCWLSEFSICSFCNHIFANLEANAPKWTNHGRPKQKLQPVTKKKKHQQRGKQNYEK